MRLFAADLSCLCAPVSRRSHNIPDLSSAFLYYYCKPVKDPHCQPPITNFSPTGHSDDEIYTISSLLLFLFDISLPPHFLLLLLCQRNQCLLLSNALLASEVKGNEHYQDEGQENGRPDCCEISESALGDPEHEADHYAEHATDGQQHDRCV